MKREERGGGGVILNQGNRIVLKGKMVKCIESNPPTWGWDWGPTGHTIGESHSVIAYALI